MPCWLLLLLRLSELELRDTFSMPIFFWGGGGRDVGMEKEMSAVSVKFVGGQGGKDMFECVRSCACV